MLENGYGYKTTVANTRSLISTLEINEDDFVTQANKLRMKDYTDFDIKIEKLLVEMSKRKDSWKVIEVYKRIDIDAFSQYFKNLE
ncbi:MAG: hypothetical protein LBD76_02955 [Prevotellaceae bacterium]|nr:hypothetical protein [Prevotellaceae bacterium]